MYLLESFRDKRFLLLNAKLNDNELSLLRRIETKANRSVFQKQSESCTEYDKDALRKSIEDYEQKRDIIVSKVGKDVSFMGVLSYLEERLSIGCKQLGELNHSDNYLSYKLFSKSVFHLIKSCEHKTFYTKDNLKMLRYLGDMSSSLLSKNDFYGGLYKVHSYLDYSRLVKYLEIVLHSKEQEIDVEFEVPQEVHHYGLMKLSQIFTLSLIHQN